MTLFKKIFILPVLFFFFSVTACLADDTGNAICSAPNCRAYTVMNGDVQISVDDWGASNTGAPAILFIHGYPHDQLLWLRQINSNLKNKYRIITMDWRGFGLSSKPEDSASYSLGNLADDINAVLNTLNVNKVVLVGHSAGGISINAYLQKYGTSRVAGLVFTDALADGGVFGSITSDAFSLIGQGIVAPTANDFMAANQGFLSLSTKAPLSLGLNNFLLIQDLLTPQSVRQAIFASLNPGAMLPLNNLAANVLIIWGDSDAVIKTDGATYLHSIIPNSQLVMIANSGHCPMLEQPAAYNKALASFVDSLQ